MAGFSGYQRIQGPGRLDVQSAFGQAAKDFRTIGNDWEKRGADATAADRLARLDEEKRAQQARLNKRQDVVDGRTASEYEYKLSKREATKQAYRDLEGQTTAAVIGNTLNDELAKTGSQAEYDAVVASYGGLKGLNGYRGAGIDDTVAAKSQFIRKLGEAGVGAGEIKSAVGLRFPEGRVTEMSKNNIAQRDALLNGAKARYKAKLGTGKSKSSGTTSSYKKGKGTVGVIKDLEADGFSTQGVLDNDSNTLNSGYSIKGALAIKVGDTTMGALINNDKNAYEAFLYAAKTNRDKDLLQDDDISEGFIAAFNEDYASRKKGTGKYTKVDLKKATNAYTTDVANIVGGFSNTTKRPMNAAEKLASMRTGKVPAIGGKVELPTTKKVEVTKSQKRPTIAAKALEVATSGVDTSVIDPEIVDTDLRRQLGDVAETPEEASVVTRAGKVTDTPIDEVSDVADRLLELEGKLSTGTMTMRDRVEYRRLGDLLNELEVGSGRLRRYAPPEKLTSPIASPFIRGN